MAFTKELIDALGQCLTKAASASESAPSKKFLIALSGGCDSTALLLALTQVAAELDLQLTACHINHNLRGEESDQDEAFCQSLCQSLKLSLDVRRLADLGENDKPSEEDLRNQRYLNLLDAARVAKTRYVLTAHTLDDQVETLLFRLLRGTAARGLLSMSSVRLLAQDIFLMRPLLSVSKEECRRFLLENGITAKEDSSNLSDAYTRNYLRNAIIPVIAERFPHYRQHIEQFRQIIQAEEEILEDATEKLCKKLDENRGPLGGWSLALLANESTAMKRRAISEALRRHEVEINFERVSAIIDLLENSADRPMLPGKKWKESLSVSENWLLRLSETELSWEETHKDLEVQPLCLTVKIPGNTIALACQRVLNIEDLSKGDPVVNHMTNGKFPPAWADEALVNLRQIKPPLLLRSRHPGDYIQPFGMNEKVRLKKFLHTHKYNQPDSPLSPPYLLLADQEEVLWVPGFGLSEKVRVQDTPTHRLKWMPLANDQIILA